RRDEPRVPLARQPHARRGRHRAGRPGARALRGRPVHRRHLLGRGRRPPWVPAPVGAGPRGCRRPAGTTEPPRGPPNQARPDLSADRTMSTWTPQRRLKGPSVRPQNVDFRPDPAPRRARSGPAENSRWTGLPEVTSWTPLGVSSRAGAVVPREVEEV